ncbi:Formin-like protein 3 [Sarracenia purpurea var. burkii]
MNRLTKPTNKVDLNRAKNCEIMLTKIKVPLLDMMNAVLVLDSSALDIDQVENLIKFCPTKEEMTMLKNYSGNKDMLGKCEQFFLELMKVPRVESKLRVFAFRITFSSQVNDLRCNLHTINDAAREVKESAKLRQVMQTILTLGNALNQGTARGSAVGFKLDSLLKLSDTRARNNKMTLMHYLCKLLAEKMPAILDFDKDLIHLEAASKIQLKALAEEMQAVSKGLEKVEQELTASENDGDISSGFQQALKNFLDTAEAEVRKLISLYSEVGRSADSLSQYFGEDPARCPFEQVTQILAIFCKMFNKARDENEQQADAEKKKLEKEAMKEQHASAAHSAKKHGPDHPDSSKPNYRIQKHSRSTSITEAVESLHTLG